MAEEDRAKHINYLLDLIDHHLSYRDDYSRRLWAILSALRGPDESGTSELKSRTTIALRSATFPKTANLANLAYPYVNGVEFGKVGMSLPDIALGSYADNLHFLSHVHDATVALEKLGRAPRKGEE